MLLNGDLGGRMLLRGLGGFGRFPASGQFGFALGTHDHCGFVPAFPIALFYAGHTDKNIQ